MSLKKKLNRFQAHLQQEKKDHDIHVPTQFSGTIPYLEEWIKEGIYPYFSEHSYCFIKEKIIPLHEKRGKYIYSQFLRAVSLWNETHLQHPLSANGYTPQDLFFFDTETTGLSRGTGNTIFLLGTAYFTHEHVVIKQYILPNPAGEIALYESFLKDVNYETLVTYNGKAFDWPQVKTRHTLVREHVPKLPSFGHFDLFHACKRIWKDELDSLKLTNIERNVLDIDRKDDLPGHLAPLIYFDFLERQHPEGMLKVLKHNEEDLLSLITLYTHITLKLLLKDHQSTTKEQMAVGKWFSYVKEHDYAIDVYKQALENAKGKEKWYGLHALAFQLKQKKQFEDALNIWLDIYPYLDGKWKWEAYIEAAKILEHRKKDVKKAYDLIINALENINEIDHHENTVVEQFYIHLQKRFERLKRKLKY